MGKRTTTDSAATRPSDFWPTPPAAVIPLVEHLRFDTYKSKYVEPCAGDGALVDALAAHGFQCLFAGDIAPLRDNIVRRDAAKIFPPGTATPIVTNPPWRRALLEPILKHLVGRSTLWLLLPLDYAANLWTNPFMLHVNKLVPLGRVSWLGNGKAGMDNSAWFRFDVRRQNFIVERKSK